jgi:hypothetical protein
MTGALGGGGGVSTANWYAQSGSPNTGGGGCGSLLFNYLTSGSGGSGIVIIRYLTSALTLQTGATYTDSKSVIWTYNGTTWKKPQGTLGPAGPTGPQGNGVNDVPRITSRIGSVSNSAGGTITLSGTDFSSGCTVYINSTAATTTTVNNSTQVTAIIPSGITAGTYFIYVYNPDGSSGFLPNGITIT